ncbi:MAG TPA: hypothetical protein VE817_02905 [Candidatus Acidoferrum sp.]|nr:hypothetical protein [Candidatus Acidoferrum sp.]
MAKKIDPKAKAKRQKIYAGIGGVILLAVLAFQVPRTLKLLHQSNASASSATTSSSSTTTSSATGPIVPPSLGGGNATPGTSAVSSDGVNDPGVLPAPQSGQLLAFSRFQTKDPFAQQLSTGATGTSGSTGSGATGSTGATGGGSGSGSTGGSGSSGGGGNQPPVKLTSATISVNGVSETVQVGGQFPASNPTFVLVSVTRTTAKVAIAGGSIQGGQQTVTVKKNTPVTLMNTADGTRYVLRLVSVS